MPPQAWLLGSVIGSRGGDTQMLAPESLPFSMCMSRRRRNYFAIQIYLQTLWHTPWRYNRARTLTIGRTLTCIFMPRENRLAGPSRGPREANGERGQDMLTGQ